MPYNLYSYNVLCPLICFNVEGVSRPACFIDVKHGKSPLKRSAIRASLPIPHESVPIFWGFPLTYCDRSLFCGVHLGQTENKTAIENGLHPYILDHCQILALNIGAGPCGEDSGDEEFEDDIDHMPFTE